MMDSSFVTHRATSPFSPVTALRSMVISGVRTHLGMRFGSLLWARRLDERTHGQQHTLSPWHARFLRGLYSTVERPGLHARESCAQHTLLTSARASCMASATCWLVLPLCCISFIHAQSGGGIWARDHQGSDASVVCHAWLALPAPCVRIASSAPSHALLPVSAPVERSLICSQAANQTWRGWASDSLLITL